MAKLGSAFVEIAADLKKLQAGFKQAQSDTNKFLKNVNKQLSFLDFTPLVKNLASIGMRIATITAPITITGGAIYALAQKAANAGDMLAKMSDKTGLAVEELYSLKKLAEQSGMGTAQLSDGLRTLAKNLTMARGVADDAKGAFGDLRRMMVKLGVDINKPLLGVLTDLAGVFSRVEDGEAKLTLAMKLFGEMAGQDMIPTLDALNKKGLELSGTFSEKSARAAEDFNTNITELKQNLADFTYKIGNKVIPMLNTFFGVIKAGGEEAYKAGILSQMQKDLNALSGIRGITSIKDMPFIFGGKAQKTTLPADLFGTTETTTAGDDIQTAKAIADTYKGMYDTLKFDAKAYYNFRADALEDQREKEIEITGDITLAWQAYYARLKELDNERIRHSGTAMEGIKLFFEEEARAPQSWASEAETAMGGFKDAMKSGAFSIVRNTEDIGDAFQNMASMVLDSIARIGTNMMVNALFSSIGGMIGGASLGAGTSTIGASYTGGAGSTISSGGGVNYNGMTGFTGYSMSAQSKATGDTITNYYQIDATDADSFVKMLKRNRGVLNEITVKGKQKSRNFEKSMR